MTEWFPLLKTAIPLKYNSQFFQHLYWMNEINNNEIIWGNCIGYIPEVAITTLIIRRRSKILILKASSIFLASVISWQCLSTNGPTAFPRRFSSLCFLSISINCNLRSSNWPQRCMVMLKKKLSHAHSAINTKSPWITCIIKSALYVE